MKEEHDDENLLARRGTTGDSTSSRTAGAEWGDTSVPFVEESTGTERYHRHLDVCARCRLNPFDQCRIGERLLRAAVDDQGTP